MLLHYLMKRYCQQIAINDKLVGSVATYLRFAGIVIVLITKLRKVYCRVCE